MTFSTGANGEFQEDLFFHTREKALIVADMLLCLDDEQLPTGINKFMAQVGVVSLACRVDLCHGVKLYPLECTKLKLGSVPLPDRVVFSRG